MDSTSFHGSSLVLAEKQTLYQTVLSDTPEIRSLKPRLDRGEARALSLSKECQSLWLYLPINNHHASIPAQGIAWDSACPVCSPLGPVASGFRPKIPVKDLDQAPTFPILL